MGNAILFGWEVNFHHLLKYMFVLSSTISAIENIYI